MSGDLDEIRVSEKYRNSKWAAYEYENQRPGGGLLSYELEYMQVPHFSQDLNLTIVQGQEFSFQIRSLPPATEYSLSGGSLPSGVSLNSATGLLEGNTSDAVSSLSFTLTASNAKGSTNSTLNIEIRDAINAPVISTGEVVATFGRGAHLRGILHDAGGASNQVTVYYGLTDGGTVISGWDDSLSLGSKNQGSFDAHISGLDSGKNYHYRFYADNSLNSWSDLGSFSTLRFDQGIIRIHTGDDASGINSGFTGIETMEMER